LDLTLKQIQCLCGEFSNGGKFLFGTGKNNF
jgi:hypothetical protein